MRYARLWNRLYDVPLLIAQDKATVLEGVFRAHVLGARDGARVRIDEDDPPAPLERSVTYMAAGLALRRGIDKPYALTEGGTALIPVMGTLVHRGSWMDAMSGLSSYDRIAGDFEAAMADPEVRAVMLEVDSPGGEGAGVMELSQRIEAGAAAKPVWAAVDADAYSAAYWLASAAERISAPTIGGVGSIGAVALHVDQSVRDAKQGYTYNFVTSGARKAEFSSHLQLSEGARGWLQAEVDRVGGLFADHVARRRGIDAAAVRATQAGIMAPDEALAGGYIDAIAPLAEAVAQLEAAGERSTFFTSRGLSAQPKETAMADAPKPAAGDVAAKQYTQADLDRARTEGETKGRTDALAEGTGAAQTGASAERERIRSILACDEAKPRGRLALSLATETDMSLEAARKVLASGAAEGDGKGSGFLQAMAQLNNPKVGAEGGSGEDGTQMQPRIDAAAIYAARAAAAAKH